MNDLKAREYNNQRVVTFKDIDEVHQRPSGTARKAFNRNKNKFIEREDYFLLTPNVRQTDIRNIIIPNRGITVLTESGYLLLVKSFDDELSWEVQRRLVNVYFNQKNETRQITQTSHSPCSIPIKSSTPVPRRPNTQWYQRNKQRLQNICDRLDISHKELYHQLLKRIGQDYDLQAANEIYRKERGFYPGYAIDIVGYFPELEKEADRLLDNLHQYVKSK